MVDKVQERLPSWNSKSLNIAGRMTLIQAVTSSIFVQANQATKLLCQPVRALIDKHKKEFIFQSRTWCVNRNAKGGFEIKKTAEINKTMFV